MAGATFGGTQTWEFNAKLIFKRRTRTKGRIVTIFQVCLFGLSSDRQRTRDALHAVSRSCCFYDNCGVLFIRQASLSSLCRAGAAEQGAVTWARARNPSRRTEKSRPTDRLALRDLLFHRLQADLLQDQSGNSQDKKKTSTSCDIFKRFIRRSQPASAGRALPAGPQESGLLSTRPVSTVQRVNASALERKFLDAEQLFLCREQTFVLRTQTGR